MIPQRNHGLDKSEDNAKLDITSQINVKMMLNWILKKAQKSKGKIKIKVKFMG